MRDSGRRGEWGVGEYVRRGVVVLNRRQLLVKQGVSSAAAGVDDREGRIERDVPLVLLYVGVLLMCIGVLVTDGAYRAGRVCCVNF